ncbi:hypothetical protein BDK51DRAFT_16622, partial [Blyttiomyces helicus]
QDEAKKKGLPWSAAKGFDTFTPVSGFIPKESIPDTDNVRLWLQVDGQTKQDGTTKDFIFRIPTLIEHVSAITKLEEGDLILTGTPAGVGPVLPGQTITAGLGLVGSSRDLISFSFPVVSRPNLRKGNL